MTASSRSVAVVTGASEGIGAELARTFAANGHDLALVARRRERLEALADEIAATGRPRPLVVALDLSGADAAEMLAGALDAAGVSPTFLVNNAGFGALGRAAEIDPAAQLGIIDLNVRALTALTLRFLPAIVQAKGGVLNVSSMAAFMPGPGMAVYYASKAYVLSFSEALAQELKPSGVRVCALCPGLVMTGFQARAGIERGPLRSRLLALKTARQTAEAGYQGLIAGKRVVVPGAVQSLMARLLPFIPRAILLPQVAAMQKSRNAE